VYQRIAGSLAKKVAKESIDVGLELSRFVEEHRLPPHASALRNDRIYTVPLAPTDQPDEPAIALTGKTQVGWILQLVNTRRYAIHCDGKHKLHDGKWLLISFCTHVVRQRTNSDCKSNATGIVHSLRPLIYVFCKGHEDVGSVLFGCKAMELVAKMCALPLRSSISKCRHHSAMHLHMTCTCTTLNTPCTCTRHALAHALHLHMPCTCTCPALAHALPHALAHALAHAHAQAQAHALAHAMHLHTHALAHCTCTRVHLHTLCSALAHTCTCTHLHLHTHCTCTLAHALHLHTALTHAKAVVVAGTTRIGLVECCMPAFPRNC
jgi:hypothetical protein